MIKKVTNKVVLLFLYSLEALFAFIAVMFIIYVVGMSFSVNSDYQYSEDEIQFYVLSNGVHTDICLPVDSPEMDWSTLVELTDYSHINFEPKYIQIGWGDKGFFLDTPTWNDLTFSTAVKAVFLPSATAMHVAYWRHNPNLGDNVKRVSMSREEYKALIMFIKSSFLLDSGAQSMLIPNKGYGKYDNFYEANGNYYFLKTCNTWTNQALHKAGIKTSVLALFEDGIMKWI